MAVIVQLSQEYKQRFDMKAILNKMSSLVQNISPLCVGMAALLPRPIGMALLFSRYLGSKQRAQ